MKYFKFILLLALTIFSKLPEGMGCSVLYYINPNSGEIYIVNNEDYLYDVNAYILIEPESKNGFGRLWYGWDHFAQGGLNNQGLFFDAAVTPKQPNIPGYGQPENNLGDRILAKCKTVQEALDMLEKEKIAVTDSHIMFGDKYGNAVIIEWVDSQKKLHWINGNKLLMTNFLLSKPEAGNFPCYRFKSIENKIHELETSNEEIDLLKIGNTFSQAGQIAFDSGEGLGGTLYTSFINLSKNQFYLSYKLSNKRVIKLDLNEEFSNGKRRKIRLNRI